KVTLKKGILGFENLKEYELLDIEDNDYLKEFNSTEEEGIGFVGKGINWNQKGSGDKIQLCATIKGSDKEISIKGINKNNKESYIV
ncbi:flagellar assembly protein FliW, partial [Clostridioides difficile]